MKEPYYKDERATIFNADSLAVLAQLPDHSVDAVITDPPYSSGGVFSTQRKVSTATKYVSSNAINQNVNFTGDTRDQRSYQYWCALWMSECLRIVKPGGFFITFTDWRQYAATADAIQAGGWLWRGTVTWTKSPATVRPQKGRFTQPCEFALWATNGDRPIDYKSDDPSVSGWLAVDAPRGDARQHQTQKPVDLIRHLMKPLAPGSVVLDPFAGSGTTGVAAMLEGHDVILCEMIPHYADICVERVRTAQMKAEPASGNQHAFDLIGLES